MLLIVMATQLKKHYIAVMKKLQVYCTQLRVGDAYIFQSLRESTRVISRNGG